MVRTNSYPALSNLPCLNLKSSQISSLSVPAPGDGLAGGGTIAHRHYREDGDEGVGENERDNRTRI